ncbi:MAG: asparagine synthase (glutamine-hydrolyzing) [Pseudomonadota bacterium]
MCGIAGFIDLKRRMDPDVRVRTAEAMHEAIAHRGPDDAAVWLDADAGVTLAHRRLAIIDLSPEGRQPMVSQSGRYVIVFNGEVYNFPDLRKRLEAQGATFRGRSDTEVMLAAFDAWGVDASIPLFNGMFAFAVWDRETRRMTFARDRFGKKPLYVGWAGDALIFASELKAFHRHPAFVGAVDRSALRNYTLMCCVSAPYAIYEGVYQLLPASSLTVDPSALAPGEDLAAGMTRYWVQKDVVEAARAAPDRRGVEAVLEDFEQQLLDAVSERMISDVPIGAFLSGGVDSSLIVAMMQKASDNPVRTFCIGFDEPQFNEAEHAKAIADHLKTDHTELTISSREALDVVPSLPDLYDEPFADPSQIPTYLVCKIARPEATVVLTGDGGDELLGGYPRHYDVPNALQKLTWPPLAVRRAAASMVRALPFGRLHRMAPNNQRLLRRMRRAADMMAMDDPQTLYQYIVGNWRTADDIVLGGEDRTVPALDPAQMPTGLSLSEAIIYNDAFVYRPDDLMVKIDRAGMAVSLEARAPLMDYKLYEFCARLPFEYSVRDGGGKWLLKELLSRHVPRPLWDRPKMGFSVPLNEWLRADLKEWAGDLLSDETIRRQGYWRPEVVAQAWSDHQDGVYTKPTAGHLWGVLMFQAWLERWAPQNARSKADAAERRPDAVTYAAAV